MKKGLLLLMIIAFSLVGWYLFVKEYDYKFKFQANSGQASVFQEIKNLEKSGLNNQQETVTIKEIFPFSQILQNISSNGSSLSMEWNFKHENDSLTSIEVNTVDPENKLKNRLSILNPFQESDYVTNLTQTLTGIKQRLDTRQQAYIVRTHGISESPELTCICISSRNIPVEQKAKEMLVTIEIIENYFVDYNIKLNGLPFLKVTDWNIEEEKINFDFCFPVEASKRLEETALVKIKKYPAFKSLKAIYRGNYRQSHLAWYELMEKGRRENINLEPQPLEVFHNNPRMGESAISWKAEVYMPLKGK